MLLVLETVLSAQQSGTSTSLAGCGGENVFIAVMRVGAGGDEQDWNVMGWREVFSCCESGGGGRKWNRNGDA